MSPLAARKAEKLGYKKIKVFHAGLPAWKKAGNIIVSNIAAIENYNKTGRFLHSPRSQTGKAGRKGPYAQGHGNGRRRT